MALFRREVMEGRGTRLEGAVSLALPVSWQIVGGVLFALVAGAVLFLLVATTDRIAAMETTVIAGNRATAIPREDDALPTDACGTLTGTGFSTRACVTQRAEPSAHALSSGEVVTGSTITLSLAAPVPTGARGTTRIVTGRETLWDALTR